MQLLTLSCFLILVGLQPVIGSWMLYDPVVPAKEVAAFYRKASDYPILSENVHELNDESIDMFLRKEPSAAVLFYMSMCDRCTLFLPRFAEAAKHAASLSLPVKFAQIDAERNQSMLDAHGIELVPTVKLFLEGRSYFYRGGSRTFSVIRWIMTHLQTGITISNSQQLDSLILIDQDILTLIGHFKTRNGSSENLGTFTSLSKKHDDVTFAEIEDPLVIEQLVKKYQAPKEIINMKEFLLIVNPHFKKHPAIEPQIVLYTGTLSNATNIELFIKIYRFPAVSDFNGEIAYRLHTDDRPIWILFTDAEVNKPLNLLAIEGTRTLANIYRQDIVFIHSDGRSLFDARLKALLDVENEKFPTIVLQANAGERLNWYSTLRYRPPQDILESFDLEGLKKFINLFKEGKLEPFVRSEPLPVDNKGPVRILVAVEYEKLVHQSKGDVLVEFHAPWCGHCRQFEPMYQRIGEMLSTVQHLSVMKLDATQNRVDLNIEGYPTLVLFVHDLRNPAKKKPIFYKGTRTIENIIRWVAAHVRVYRNINGTVSIDGATTVCAIPPSTEEIDIKTILGSSKAAKKAQEIVKKGDAVDWSLEDL